MEGDGDDADGQESHLHGYFADDRGSSGARTTAHTSGDEDHAGIARGEGSAYLVFALEGSFLGTLGLSPSAETASDLRADGDLVLYGATAQCLLIGVTQQEGHPWDRATGVHLRDGVTATATYAHDLDELLDFTLGVFELYATTFHCIHFV